MTISLIPLVTNREPATVSHHDQWLQVLERRWAITIIARLCEGPKGFTELQRAIPEISTKMMVQRLQELQGYGIVERVASPPFATRTKYSLTASAHSLRPAIEAILQWASTDRCMRMCVPPASSVTETVGVYS